MAAVYGASLSHSRDFDDGPRLTACRGIAPRVPPRRAGGSLGSIEVPQTHYARSGDLQIAYQVAGEGPLDIILIPPYLSNIEMFSRSEKAGSPYSMAQVEQSAARSPPATGSRTSALRSGPGCIPASASFCRMMISRDPQSTSAPAPSASPDRERRSSAARSATSWSVQARD